MGHDPQVMGVGITGANLVPSVSFFPSDYFRYHHQLSFSNTDLVIPLSYLTRLKNPQCL